MSVTYNFCGSETWVTTNTGKIHAAEIKLLRNVRRPTKSYKTLIMY
jgi:hypothetical protein